MGRLHRVVAVLTFVVAAAIGTQVSAQQIRQVPVDPLEMRVSGDKPRYTDRKLTVPDNLQSLWTFHWSPGLDDGYVSQGLSAIGNEIFVATYKSVDRDQSRGSCRVFRLTHGFPNQISGNPEQLAPISYVTHLSGHLDLPATCGHAGGLARGPGRTLWVADTRVLFEVALGAPDDRSIGKVVRTISLKGDVRGSFAAGSADALWLGTYAREGTPRLYKFPFERLTAKPEIGEADATASLPMPLNAQGAAFDASGKLWITRSGSKFGELLRLDPTSGAVEARFAMPAGIEDISFDAAGRLWAVSEAGSRRWNDWETFFPVVFAIDVARLR